MNDFDREMECLAIDLQKLEIRVVEEKLRQATSEADTAGMIERYTAQRIADDRNPLGSN